METILIVDDEKNYPPVLAAILGDEGYETFTANSGEAALGVLKSAEVDLLLTDLKMPRMDGMELMVRVKELDPDLPVIMMTAYGTVEMGLDAMDKGAHSYIWKPFNNDQLILFVKRALAVRRMVRENRLLKSELLSQYGFDNIIGKSKAMRDVFETIRKVAPTTATVLIEGESGTGKELVAKSIHFNGPRREKPFIAVNCAALAETLLESELFGHEKGAFTGATSLKKGRFELADGGTLFLDEIGEISPSLQVKLLRVLQERVFERVGGTRPVQVDIRIIAATNRNLKREMEAGRFREDLFYRLCVLSLTLPPLRERSGDIRLLVDHFIKKYAPVRKAGTPVTGLRQDVERLFYEYAWPGNVRELENIIERAVILAAGGLITVEDLPRDFQKTVRASLPLEGIAPDAKLADTLGEVERMMIERALKMTGGIQAHAAEILGIAKSGLSQKIKKYGLDVGSLS
jgi:two-component system NtrC family response regulator